MEAEDQEQKDGWDPKCSDLQAVRAAVPHLFDQIQGQHLGCVLFPSRLTQTVGRIESLSAGLFVSSQREESGLVKIRPAGTVCITQPRNHEPHVAA